MKGSGFAPLLLGLSLAVSLVQSSGHSSKHGGAAQRSNKFTDTKTSADSDDVIPLPEPMIKVRVIKKHQHGKEGLGEVRELSRAAAGGQDIATGGGWSGRERGAEEEMTKDDASDHVDTGVRPGKNTERTPPKPESLSFGLDSGTDERYKTPQKNKAEKLLVGGGQDWVAPTSMSFMDKVSNLVRSAMGLLEKQEHLKEDDGARSSGEDSEFKTKAQDSNKESISDYTKNKKKVNTLEKTVTRGIDEGSNSTPTEQMMRDQRMVSSHGVAFPGVLIEEKNVSELPAKNAQLDKRKKTTVNVRGAMKDKSAGVRAETDRKMKVKLRGDRKPKNNKRHWWKKGGKSKRKNKKEWRKNHDGGKSLDNGSVQTGKLSDEKLFDRKKSDGTPSNGYSVVPQGHEETVEPSHVGHSDLQDDEGWGWGGWGDGDDSEEEDGWEDEEDSLEEEKGEGEAEDGGANVVKNVDSKDAPHDDNDDDDEDDSNGDLGSDVVLGGEKDNILPSNLIRIDYPEYTNGYEESFYQLQRLTRYYAKCETCMVSSRTGQCPYYRGQTSQLRAVVDDLNSLFTLGCGLDSRNGGKQCCHTRTGELTKAVEQLTRAGQSLVSVLRHQCNKCPVDCEWEAWSAWSDCPPCQSGHRRNRNRRERFPSYGGRPCPGPNLQVESCPAVNVTIGIWSPWSAWSQCSRHCQGLQTRKRQCGRDDRRGFSGPIGCFAPCQGDNVQTVACGRDRCCYDRQWSTWGHWEPCTDPKVGRSKKSRRRLCSNHPSFPNEAMCPDPCPGVSVQEMDCPICEDSRWTEWGEWSTCSGRHVQSDRDTGRPCGRGQRSRSRSCVESQCGGRSCVGRRMEAMDCNLGPCCEPPEWGRWGSWSACSVSVGMGVAKRSRLCRSRPQYWSSPTCHIGGCNGQGSKLNREDFEMMNCSGICQEPCIDSEWGTWGSWSVYDKDTGESKRVRCCIRHRDSADHCKHECVGEKEQVDQRPCVSPRWGEWASWSVCVVNNGRYSRSRDRDCVVRTPYERCLRECTGAESESEECPCDAPYLSEWTFWSSCVGSDTVRTRSRSCVTDPRCPDQECRGHTQDSELCPCTAPYLSEWTLWSSCVGSDTVRTRSRSCVTDPRCPDQVCRGHTEDRKPCPCRKPTWSGWSSWSACQGGSIHRTRTCDRRGVEPNCNTDCWGVAREEMPCPCTWANWVVKTDCETSVRRRRVRVCTATTFRHVCRPGDCPGSDTQDNPCEVDCDEGAWATWSHWGDCSCDKLKQVQTRVREKRSRTSRELCLPERQKEERHSCHDECRTGCAEICAEDPVARDSKRFPSCGKNCNFYVQCCEGNTTTVACPDNTFYDSECRECLPVSRTCNKSTGYVDIHVSRFDIAYRTCEEP
ncbi:SCO-spondin [Aplysia californica]|uniref:SCO-spondin n=1 Tax=Aplysia californica TaxID=6500 RepID=A0ABM1AD22_APLCA|nr:SCO-spondin [Aplysia californica]